VQSRYAKWTLAQKKALDELRQIKPKPDLQSALQRLDFKGLFANVTREEFKKWWDKQNTPKEDRVSSLADIRYLLERHGKTPVNCLTDRDAFTVPLKSGPHLISGQTVKGITKDSKPRQTVCKCF
jgi:hypothetical protein